MLNHFRILIVFSIVIISIKFFETKFLPENLMMYLQFLAVLGIIILSAPHVFIPNSGFVFPVKLMLFSFVVSIIMAKVFWGQGFSHSIKATLPYLIWILFFYLLQIKFPIQTLEKIIIFYGLLYTLLYVFQYAHHDTVMFGYGDKFREERGVIRILIPGGGLYILAGFLGLNKLTTQKKNRWIWLPLALVGIVLPVMQVTRQLIATMLFIYLFHFVKGLNIFKKITILGVFAALLIFISNIDHPIVEGLQDAQKETVKTGEKNIRIQAATYFLTDFQPNIITRILGNGVSYGNKSEYGKFISKLKVNRKFYLSDVGIVALLTLFGVMAVLAYVIIWIKSIIIKIPDEYYYAKYYLWYLLITCFTSSGVFNLNYFVSTIFALYILHTVNNQERLKSILNILIQKESNKTSQTALTNN